MKKLAVLILTGAIVAGTLSGCAGAAGTSQEAAQPQETAEAVATEAGDAVEEAAEEAVEAAADAEALSPAEEAIAARKESGEVPKLVISYMNWSGRPAGSDRISEKMSEITREKIGVDVELLIMDAATYKQNMNLMLASGEQIDLFNGVAGFMAAVNKGNLYDLEEDELIQTYGQGILDIFTDTEMDGCRVGGTLYGVPVKKDDAVGLCAFSIPEEYLDEIGFDYQSLYEEGEEVIRTDMDTIEGILTDLHEAYPDKTTFYFDKVASIADNSLVVDPIGGDVYGVLADPLNSLEVTNLFTDEAYLDLVRRMYKWNQMGFFSKDALTETTATTVQVKAGSLCAYKTGTKPGIKEQESRLCGMPMVIFQVGPDFKKSSAYNKMPWCINQNTSDPVAAMQLLELLYTDPELSTLFCWGEEGTEWVETGDGHITFPEGIDAQNSEYFNNVNWELPNQFIARIWEGDSLDIWERMQKFNDGAEASAAMGFTWENNDYTAEYTALTNVYNEYQAQIEFGFVDPDVAIPEMVERLNAAGLENYIQAKQDAIDEWAEATGRK